MIQRSLQRKIQRSAFWRVRGECTPWDMCWVGAWYGVTHSSLPGQDPRGATTRHVAMFLDGWVPCWYNWCRATGCQINPLTPCTTPALRIQRLIFKTPLGFTHPDKNNNKFHSSVRGRTGALAVTFSALLFSHGGFRSDGTELVNRRHPVAGRGGWLSCGLPTSQRRDVVSRRHAVYL